MDGIQDCFRLLQDVRVPESQHRKAFGFKPCRPLVIMVHCLSVLASIDVDHPATNAGTQINDKWADGNLMAEALAVDVPSTQSRPEMVLIIGHLDAQPTGMLLLAWRC